MSQRAKGMPRPGGSLGRRIAIMTSGVVVTVSVLIGIPALNYVRDLEGARLVSEIESDAIALAADLGGLPEREWPAKLGDYDRANGSRLSVVDSELHVVFDSGVASGSGMLNRPELRDALAGKLSSGVRDPVSPGDRLHYAAAPIRRGFTVIGAVRVMMTVTVVDQKIAPLQWGLVGLMGLVLVLGVIVSWLVATAVSRPLEQLAEAARELGEDPSRRIGPIRGPKEVQQVGVSLDNAADRLSEALQRSQDVATEASHHLRTPLAALRLRVEAMGDLADGDLREEAESALVEVDRLNRRVEQLLTIARTQGVRAPVDVGELVSARAQNWDDIAAGRGITIVCEPPSKGIYSLLQPGTVERAVDELISNALAYAKSEVGVVCDFDARRVWVDVWDDGPGIPESERELVFVRFVRGSQAQAGGTGLGLAMLRDTARAVGGDAVILDGAGQGARVRVIWPRSRTRG